MIALRETERCALAGTDCRPTPLRRRAGRPQLKRDPLGSTMSMPLSHLDSDGFVILPGFLSEGELGHLEQILPPVDPEAGGLRNLLDIPQIATFAEGEHVGSLV